MTRSPSWAAMIIAVWFAVVGGMALAAQDKYTLQVPNGLAFSDFRGYEDWQVVSVSQTEELLKAMVANPVMIDAQQPWTLGPGSAEREIIRRCADDIVEQ
jgi:hypothetical protein